MKIAIIGAGAAGMTAAYTLAKKNCKVDIYEASSKIGGLAATINLWNQKVDIGPHRFFSNDRKVNSLWLELAGNDYQMVNRLTRIYYKNQFYDYPIKLSNVVTNLGFLEAGKCLFSYFYERLNSTKPDGSFESWVQRKFGKRLFEVFFKTYTEKLWGIPCNQLDSDFAAQRIKKLSMYESVKNAVLNGKGNKHKTLVEQFAYPMNGTGIVYERMADFVRNSGNNIYLNTPVFKVITKNAIVTGIELENGKIEEYDYVISSMPYTSMVKRLSEIPENIRNLTDKLKYRNTIIVYLLINSEKLFPDNWIYIHSDDLLMGRITNFRNWVPSLYKDEKQTILSIEYWCNEDCSIWKFSDAELIKLASAEIIKTKLVESEIIEKGHIYRIPKSYPIYSKGYKEILKPINKYIASITNLSVIGRYGSFKYNNQDHSILMGLLAAENILDKTEHELSQINSDYETYQESYIITKTGLQKQ